MKNCNLYVILDRQLLCGKDLAEIAKRLIDGGVSLIQYRDKISPQEEILKKAEELMKLNCSLIINDYPEIARAVGAYGVHLGQDDMDIESARKMLGKGKIIGRSTHNLKQALLAEKQGADYIGIGPVFPTGTKKEAVPIGLEVLKEVSANIKIPTFAVGGILLDNIESVLSTGIDRVSVASAIICADNIKESVKRFRYELDRIGINSKE